MERILTLTAEAEALIGEYYEAAAVVQRDGAEAMRALLADPRSAMWVAYVAGEAAGCVVLKAGVPGADAGECKRLYVRPAFRRGGVADALMEALESFVKAAGLGWVYLDTNDAFRASVALYRRRGYEACARYNENPQATLFFRKRI